MTQRNMVGKKYRHFQYGIVTVIRQSGYVKGSPRNVEVELENGAHGIVPQRSLRKIKDEYK